MEHHAKDTLGSNPVLSNERAGNNSIATLILLIRKIAINRFSDRSAGHLLVVAATRAEAVPTLTSHTPARGQLTAALMNRRWDIVGHTSSGTGISLVWNVGISNCPPSVVSSSPPVLATRSGELRCGTSDAGRDDCGNTSDHNVIGGTAASRPQHVSNADVRLIQMPAFRTRKHHTSTRDIDP